MKLNTLRRLAGSLLVLLLIFSACGQKLSEPPVAKKVPVVTNMFGHEMIDNYNWIRDDNRTDETMLAYLNAENEYTASMMSHTTELQATLFAELKGRIKETDLSVPVWHNDYFYYDRTEEGEQYSIYCRKKGSLEADEEILLNMNQLAAGKDFMDLGNYVVSPDGSMMAYATDEKGNERYALQFKNLKTGELMTDRIEGMTATIVWANDNQTVFYTTPDDAWRPDKLWRHKIGDDPKNDKLIFHEPDESFWLDVEKTKDDEHILMTMGSQTSSEYHYLKSDKPDGKFRLIHPRTPKLEYFVEHHQGRFYIVTNADDAVNFKLVSTPVHKAAKANWKDLIPYRPEMKIDGIDIFADYIVIYGRENGLKQITVRNFKDGKSHQIEFPEPAYSVSGASNPEFSSTLVRFSYQSFTTPKAVYDYEMATHTRELKKQREVLGDYDPENYQSERIFATATDGTQIPISLVYKKGMVKDGSNPMYLYAYGSYGSSMDPYFSSNRLSLLNRGFVFAIPHIRGGGEMGREWYLDGKLKNKKNTFTDFIACGEHLIAEKYTSSDKLVISGGSAGGLLIGAVVNMAPKLAFVAVASVPFVDVINTMLDASIPLTVIEYEEWGNPNEEDYFNYMLSYSPYDKVEAKAYPHMFIEGGLNDTRVGYWEPAKWVAKLRATKTDDNVLLLRTNMGAGHGGASGRYDYLNDLALEYTFILDRFGMK